MKCSFRVYQTTILETAQASLFSICRQWVCDKPLCRRDCMIAKNKWSCTLHLPSAEQWWAIYSSFQKHHMYTVPLRVLWWDVFLGEMASSVVLTPSKGGGCKNCWLVIPVLMTQCNQKSCFSQRHGGEMNLSIGEYTALPLLSFWNEQTCCLWDYY